MTMADLIALGAPRLPAGYFYRVTRTALDGVWVQVRRDARWGSRLVAKDHVDRWHASGERMPTSDGIRNAAIGAARHAATLTAETRWIGDHR